MGERTKRFSEDWQFDGGVNLHKLGRNITIMKKPGTTYAGFNFTTTNPQGGESDLDIHQAPNPDEVMASV